MENPKRRKMCQLNDNNKIVPVLSIESLPNEIFMNIFSNLNIKDLFICAQVSKKFRQISYDKSFWKCVNLFNQKVSCELIAHIIKLGTEYLNLQEAKLYIDAYADIPPKNNLKYLNLALSSVDDRFLVRLLRSSVSLEKISLTGVNYEHLYGTYERDDEEPEEKDFEHEELMLEVRRSWYIDCLLPNARMLTSLDLSNTQPYYGMLNFESIKMIVLNCLELREANFRNQFKSQFSRQYSDMKFFVKNLTPKIEKLNISYNSDFTDRYILPLLQRCKNITELDLKKCDLDRDRFDFHLPPDENQKCLIAISKHLSQSLVKLQLPDHSFLYHEFIKSLPKLRYLWKEPWINGEDGTEIMEEYPQISFNQGTAKIAHCANEYFEPEQGFWELKCTAVDLARTR